MKAAHPSQSHVFSRPATVLAAALLLGLAAAPAANAGIVTTGANFRTGVGTPTLTITAPITFTITATGTLTALVFDEWVASDGNVSVVNSVGGTTFSYELGGAAATATVSQFTDNINQTLNALSANDGYLRVFPGFAVTAGQTLTINAQSFNFGSSATFNPNLPTTFNGRVFMTTATGLSLTDSVILADVPEPSSLALVSLALAGAGFTARRRQA